MIERIQAVMRNECQVAPGAVIVAGVSGGPDSLCLLHALRQSGYPVVAAHLDHSLRPASAGEAEKVRRAAARLGAGFELRREDISAYAEQQGMSIEEAARHRRYTFLFELAEKHKAQAVAVGHTADDQVETVLMHLLRGAGLAGLAGMDYRSLPHTWSESIPLVRPLLGFWRQEILAYNQVHDLDPSLDESNLDVRFYRNRLRHELIPYLQTYNLRVKEAVWRTAEVLRADLESLQQATDEAWERCAAGQGPGWVAFNARKLLAEPAGLQRSLLRRAIGLLRPGLRDVDFAAVERALRFLQRPPRSRESDLAAGLNLRLDEGKLWLAAWEADLPGGDWPQVPAGQVLRLDIPGEVSLPGGWIFRAEQEPDVAAARAHALENANPFQAWADASTLAAPLFVRSRRPGERFHPLGMQGHSLKLSDFMINVKLPRRVRQEWPLVVSPTGDSDETIVWVPGYRLGHPFRLKTGSPAAVHLQLVCE